MGIGKKFLDAAIARLQFLDDRIDLDAIARREQHPFLDPGIRTEPHQRFPEAAFGNRQFFPDFNRRGLVAESDDNDVHVRTPIRSF